MSHIDQLLKIDSAILDGLRKKLGAKQEDIEDDIKHIKEWLEKNPHLPMEKDDRRLETFLLRRDLSVENTKKSLETYYTGRSFLKEYFEQLTPSSGMYLRAKAYTCVVAMPCLIRDFTRITVYKLQNYNHDLFDPVEAFTILSMISEIRFSADYNYYDELIIDLSGYSLKHLVKFTPKVIGKLRFIITKTINYRIRKIHLINMPALTDKILPIFKSIIPGKIFKKVEMHGNLDSLYQHVPSQMLPSDYGGEQKSLDHLFDLWLEEIEHWMPFFNEHLGIKSDEAKRVGRCHEFEIFGTGSQGSFKKLNIQ